MRDALQDPDRFPGAAHPREATRLIGHEKEEQQFLGALRAGRLHHAWMLAGPEGIGKASFAYRAARFMLAGRDPLERASKAATLVTDTEELGVRRILAQAHPDLHVLKRVPKTDGKGFSSNIPVDAVRNLIGRFAGSAAAGGWRIAIVDAADDMDRPSANALLKLLEEPPAQALFLIVAHAPGRMLPTIRSRCRVMGFAPLPAEQVAEAAGLALGNAAGEADEAALRRAASFADGSVRRALAYAAPEALALVEAVRARLDALPRLDLAAVTALAEDVAGRAGEADFAVLLETVQSWLSAHLHAHAGAGPARLAPLAEVWDNAARTARETETYNLDRRPFVMSLFHDLSDAVRRSRAA